jgi:hypothetical protein
MSAYRQFKLVIFTTLLVTGFLEVKAMDITNQIEVDNSEYLSRGEATDLVVRHFNLEKKNENFLKECKKNPGECLFSFSARTNFDEFRLEPLILYPDVYPAYKYYKSINTASKLDIVSGYFAEADSPFRPEQKIKKIEALKLVFGASGMLDWKEKFELEQNWLSFGGDKWWYARYIAEAVNKGLWVTAQNVDTEEEISKKEFLEILDKTNTIIANNNEISSQVDNGRQANKEADSSANIELQTSGRES